VLTAGQEAPSPGRPCPPLDSYSPLLVAAFRLYLRWFFWRKFHAVRLSRTGIAQLPSLAPVVVYCNHPSWWDPAVFLLTLPWIVPGRRGFAPMDAIELQRYGLFRRMGLFGIEPASPRGGAAFLRTALAGMHRPATALFITAEGHFTDPRLRPVRLRAGVAHLARRCPDAVFLPLALEYSFWNESKPEALLRFGPPVRPAEGDSVAAWQTALEDGLTRTMDALATESATRNPAAFVRLLGGTAGVGGIYDLWRRLRAAAGGRSFEAHHQPERQ
jgi:1-acyl-sn-glycerol-3-phosphate acyltransferase